MFFSVRIKNKGFRGNMRGDFFLPASGEYLEDTVGESGASKEHL